MKLQEMKASDLPTGDYLKVKKAISQWGDCEVVRIPIDITLPSGWVMESVPPGIIDRMKRDIYQGPAGRMLKTVYDWCEENTNGEFIIKDSISYNCVYAIFQYSSDAVLFRLSWTE